MPPSWSQRGRRLLPSLLWIATFLVSLVLYQSQHALEHFLWHLIYGSSFGLILASGWTLYQGRPAPAPSLWAWAGYVYMIVPDLIWVGPRLAGNPVHPHEPWMDLFLGHVFLDTWAGTTHLLVPTLVFALVCYTTAETVVQDPSPGRGHDAVD